MATKRIIDAHALVWYLEGNPRLGANAKAILDDPKSELVLTRDADIRSSGLVPIVW